MQFQTLVILLCASVASAQVTIDFANSNPSEAEIANLNNNLLSYADQIATEPQYMSFYNYLATMSGSPLNAMPTGGGAPPNLKDQASSINALLTATPSWVAVLPADIQTFIASMASVEAGIFNKDLGPSGSAIAATATGGPTAYGIAAPTLTPSAAPTIALSATGSIPASPSGSLTGSTSTATGKASSSVSSGIAAAATAAPGRTFALGLGILAGLTGIIAL